MKKAFVYILSATMIVAACVDNLQNENDQPGESFGALIKETISARVSEGDTKATIATSDGAFAWTVATDKIAVHTTGDGGSNPACYVTSDGASASAAEAGFTVNYYGSRDAFAIYPSSIVATDAENYGQKGHTLDLTLPDAYTLAEVSGETSPCPMIATNTPGAGWEFKHLCGLLRLTVNGIPASTKRLEIVFDGKKVCGDFSIASPVTPDASDPSDLPVIETCATTGSDDIITITKDRTDVVLGLTSLVLNIPLPVGVYSKITINAYDAITEGNVVSYDNVSFSYTAIRKNGVKKSSTLTDQSVFTFTFKDVDTQTDLGGLRFVRLFSCQNKLYNGSTTFGPYTVSSATGEDNIANPVSATLKFGSDVGDQLVFQVIDANGKVYSGSYDAPAGGFTMGAYELTVAVKAYKFTVSAGKQVYFSPGDLGVDNSVYSFTEPFADWGEDKITTTSDKPLKRVWFDNSEIDYNTTMATGFSIYGITWRVQKYVSSAFEWDNIIGRTIDEGNVKSYYRVTVAGYSDCLLLPPDEAVAADVVGLSNGVTVTNYYQYLAKGFVLLNNTSRVYYYQKWRKDKGSHVIYWSVKDNTNRFYLDGNPGGEPGNPKVDFMMRNLRLHARYIHDVTNP